MAIKKVPVKKATAKKAATKMVSTKKPPAPKRKAAPPLAKLKPGWLSRVFGIETGFLIACDARWTGTDWERGDAFSFLYRSRRNKYFVLRDPYGWTTVPADDAARWYASLPEKVVDRERAFGTESELEALPQSRDDDDDGVYKVLRSDAWEFSILVDHDEIPSGWWHIGVTGRKRQVLDFIRRNCVFGVENPGMI